MWGVEVGKAADLADRGGGDSEGGFHVGGVGVVVSVAVDALWHLLVLVLVEFGELWWLVAGVGGSEQLLVVGGWCLVVGSNESCCEIGLGKSLRGGWDVCIVFELLKVR